MPTPPDSKTPRAASRKKSEAEQQADYIPPPSTEEMRDDFLRQLHGERHSLKGIALVQALKALEALVKSEQAAPEKTEDIPPHSLLDQVGSLPVPHARKLLNTEIERLERELTDHRDALENLKEK